MKLLQRLTVLFVLQIFVLHSLVGMTGDKSYGKRAATALKSVVADGATKGDYQACDRSGGDGASGVTGSVGSESKVLAKISQEALFFGHIKAGRLDDVREMLAQDQKMSNCSNTLRYRDGSERKIRATWYTLECALCATKDRDRDNYLQILKTIFDVLEIYGGKPVYTGDEVLEFAPPWCCIIKTYHAGYFLHYVVDHDNVPVVQFLLDNKMVTIDELNFDGHNALAFARSVHMVNELVRLGIDVNHKALDGLRPADMVTNDKVRHAICASKDYEAHCCTCAPCVVECASCDVVMCDLLWWLRCFRCC
jgi:hypothetical protein